MFPQFVIARAGGLELGTMAIGAAIAAVSAARARRLGHDEDRERALIALFCAYFFGAIALALAVHAFAGARPVAVSSYAATLVIGVLAGWRATLLRWRRTELPLAVAYRCMMGTLVFGLLGSRLAQMLYQLDDFPTAGAWLAAGLDPRRPGLAALGGFVAIVAFLRLALRAHGAFARVCDACAGSIYLTVGVARVGCLLAGCCFGAPAPRMPFALPISWFAEPTPAARFYAGQPGAALWPVQPLEALAIFAIVAACEWAYPRRRRLGLRDGQLAAIAAATHGAARFCLEFLRADSPRSIGGVLTVWHLVALAIVGLALVAWARARGAGLARGRAG